MKKITLKRKPVFRRHPEQAVVRPDLIVEVDNFESMTALHAKSSDFLLELQRLLHSQQFKVQALAIKKIGDFELFFFLASFVSFFPPSSSSSDDD